jgi:hypothetical protein
MKTKLSVVFTLIVILLLVFYYTKSSSQDFSKTYLVKLYAGEKVISSWQSREIGKIEGESLTFVVKGEFDVNAHQVRIHGVYTVEELQ